MFLRRYIKFRGICQESYYNVARVMHQLSNLHIGLILFNLNKSIKSISSQGLFDLAAFYYKKCLEAPCLFPEQKVNPHILFGYI